jgi:hypothetical protein
VGRNAPAVSSTPAAARGPHSPVHAMADPGITDSWAMPRIPPPVPLLGFADYLLRALCRCPAPRYGGEGGALRSWESSEFLQLQVGPHQQGHVTREGAALAGGLELAFRGPYPPPPPGTLCPEPRHPRFLAQRGRSSRKSGFGEWRGFQPSRKCTGLPTPTPALGNTKRKPCFSQ